MKPVYVLISKAWAPLLAIFTFFASLWQTIKELVLDVAEKIAEAIGILVDAQQGMMDAIANGWPPQMANALAWVNTFFPVIPAAIMLGILIVLLVVCGYIRMLKSIIPGIGT